MRNENNPVIIEMHRISKFYPGVIALDSVDFCIRKGEIHALAGKNGAGKSTLIKILGGSTQPDDGQIMLKGKEIVLHSPHDAIANGIAIISQELMLIQELSVMENILIGRLPHNAAGFVDWEAAKTVAAEPLKQLGLELDLSAPVKTLSTAQQQAVEIAKALSRHAEVIIMDEPTSSLPNREVDHLLSTVRRLRDQGITIVYITHKLKEIFAISDNITVLRDGKNIATLPTSETNQAKIVELMTGQSADSMFEKGNSSSSDIPVLEVRDISRKNAFSHISFTLYKGEILGFAGLLGSGRTEILRAIFGCDALDSGSILIDGKEIKEFSVKEMIRRGIALAPEDRKLQGLVLSMNISDNINLATMSSAIRNMGKEKKTAIKLFDSMGVKAPSIKALVSSLSGGNQQKIVISKWLATEPKVVLLDEPTRGIDIGAKSDIYTLVEKLAGEGVSVIIVSSEFPELLRVCDRILTLHDGEINGEFLHNAVDEETLVAYASGSVDQYSVEPISKSEVK
jgi:ABC-type sugar transport system ATPase subunit